MRILAIAPQPFFTARGTPISVYYRSLVMANQGASIDLLTYGAGEDVEIPGVRVLRIPRIKVFEPIPLGPSRNKFFLDLFMIVWTVGLLIRHRYQAVDAHEEAVFWCRFLKPMFRFKLVYDMHSSLPQQLTNFQFTKSGILIRTFEFLEQSCLQAADLVITVCPDLRDQVLASGVPESRQILIENSMFEDLSSARTAPESEASAVNQAVAGREHGRIVLYAGTFEVYQGVDLLVRAFPEVLQRVPAARLLLVGGTETQVAIIRDLANQLGLADACTLTGHVPRSVAHGYMVRASVLVSPRLLGTNTPLKIYEHLASGKPMVATRVRSHTQVLDDSVCRLVEPTESSMAEGIVAALTEVAESARRVANAQGRYARDYSRSAYEAKIRRVLESIA